MRASARKLDQTGADVLYGRIVHPLSLPLRVAISGSHKLCLCGDAGGRTDAR